MDQEVIRIEDIIDSLKKHWKLIVITTITLSIIAAVVSFFVIKPTYMTKTTLFVGKEESSETVYDQYDIQMYQKLMKTYAEIIQTEDLIAKAIKNTGVDLKVSEVLDNLTVTQSADTQILKLNYTNEDGKDALEILQSITEQFIMKSNEIMPNVNISIIETAKLPQEPMSSNAVLLIAIAFALGLLISAIFAFLLEHMDNSFKNKDQIKRVLNLPVVGVIPSQDDLS